MRTTLAWIFVALLVHQARAITVDIQIYHHSFCGQSNGAMMALISGGTPPYTIQWSNGPTTAQNFGIGPGTYSVTVTDALLDQATDIVDIISLPGHDIQSISEEGGYCLPESPYVSFYAGTENGMPPDPSTGTYHTPGPYSFDAVGYSTTWSEIPDACSWFSYYIVNIEAPVGANVTVNFTDGAGCPGSFNTTIKPPITFPSMQVLDVTGSCSNGAIGSATVHVAPSNEPVVLHLRNAAGQYVPDECANNWQQSSPNVYTITNLAPGTYWAVLDNDLYNQFTNGTFCTDSVQVIVPDLGTTCGLVNGRVYVDNSVNCVLNGGENLVPATVVEITPGPYYATTNSYGQFSVPLPLGTYTFTELHPVLEQSCPVSGTLTGATLYNMNIGCATGAPLDVQLAMGNSPARPGFQMTYAMDIENLTPAVTGGVTLTMTFDPVLSFVSAIPAPSSVSGNVLTWTAPQLSMTNAFQHLDVNVVLQVPPDIGLLGSTLVSTATLLTQDLDNDPANNTVSTEQLVTGSYDPNDKLATTSLGGTSTWIINEDEWIDYLIRFQNTGTDTAFNVVITDTLPAELDLASITWGGASHVHTRQVLGQGVLRFTFANILLPDSGVNETASHGFVGFRIRPKQPVLPGTPIENIANIYFDFNPPVITEPSVLVAEFSTGVGEERPARMVLQPNPAADRLHVVTQASTSGSYRVLSADGREVRPPGNWHGHQLELDVSLLTPGLYMLQLDGYVERFIKQ